MTLAFERFTNDAVNVDRYIESMENNQSQFVQNAEQAAIRDEHLDYYRDQKINFLVITEDWCIDSTQFVPPLVRLAKDFEGIDIRFLRRDEHKDLAENYKRKDGYQAIPVIVVFDEDGNELGALVERPEQASNEMAEETRKFQEANPDLEGIKRNIDRMPDETQAQVKAHSRKWRMTQQDRFTDHLLNELQEMIEAVRKEAVA